MRNKFPIKFAVIFFEKGRELEFTITGMIFEF